MELSRREIADYAAERTRLVEECRRLEEVVTRERQERSQDEMRTEMAEEERQRVINNALVSHYEVINTPCSITTK